MISAKQDSTLVSAPAEGSQNGMSDGGHIETYSPPVPNLHTGSILPLSYASILASLQTLDSVPIHPALCSIDHPPHNTQTKTEQKRTAPQTFSTTHLVPLTAG